MIEFYIIVTIFLSGDYTTSYKEYATLEHCEKAKELLEYERRETAKLIVCKKIIIHTSKNNPFPRQTTYHLREEREMNTNDIEYKDRYFLKADFNNIESEVTEKEFIKAEKMAGFHSTSGPDHVATGGFSIGGVSGLIETKRI